MRLLDYIFSQWTAGFLTGMFVMALLFILMGYAR